jgi:hypothetical protein
MPTETLRLSDPDGYALLEYLRWKHLHDHAFNVEDEVRRELPAAGGCGCWSLPRFVGARQRLIRAGYLVAVNERASRVKVRA